MSVLDRFHDGMSVEDIVLNLLSTVAHISEAQARGAIQSIKDAYAHELAEKIRSQKVRSPEGEVEEHVNYVIDGLADDVAPKQRCDMREAHTGHRWTKDGITYVCKTVVLNSGS